MNYAHLQPFLRSLKAFLCLRAGRFSLQLQELQVSLLLGRKYILASSLRSIFYSFAFLLAINVYVYKSPESQKT